MSMLAQEPDGRRVTNFSESSGMVPTAAVLPNGSNEKRAWSGWLGTLMMDAAFLWQCSL